MKTLTPINLGSNPTLQQVVDAMLVTHASVAEPVLKHISKQAVRISFQQLPLKLAAACLLLPLLVLFSLFFIPDTPRPKPAFAVFSVFCATATWAVLCALQRHSRSQSDCALFDLENQAVTLPRFGVVLEQSQMEYFTLLVNSYLTMEDNLSPGERGAYQFGVVAKSEPESLFEFYEIARLDSLELRRILRDHYQRPIRSFIRHSRSEAPRETSVEF